MLNTIFYPLGDNEDGEWIFINLSITERPSPYFGDSISLTGDRDYLLLDDLADYVDGWSGSCIW